MQLRFLTNFALILFSIAILTPILSFAAENQIPDSWKIPSQRKNEKVEKESKGEDKNKNQTQDQSQEDAGNAQTSSSPLEEERVQYIDPYNSEDKDWIFSHTMKRPGKKRGSVVGYSLLSLAVPGIGQFMNGQTGAGYVYSGIGTVGLGAFVSSMIENDDDIDDDLNDAYEFDPNVRRRVWGESTYLFAGSLSLYHAFQTNVQFRKNQGEYDFLPVKAETTDELMLAPFEFSNLGRWSTILPLALGVGLAITAGANDDRHTRQLNSGDLLFSSGISYNAGVGEEALFRGWLFPVFVEAYGVDNIFWANLTQAAIFGLGHLGPGNDVPIFQLAAGYYFGWLAKKNGWSLREAIFVHTWWDVIIFTASFTQKDKKDAAIYVPLYSTQF